MDLLVLDEPELKHEKVWLGFEHVHDVIKKLVSL